MSIFRKYQKIIGASKNFDVSNINVEVTGDAASDIIYKRLLENRPVMISRFGSNELNCVLNRQFIQGGLLKNVSNILKGVPYFLSYNKGIVENMHLVAGFFPPTVKNLDRFCELYINDTPFIDILGSWLSYEKYLSGHFNKDIINIQLEDLSPFNHTNPWSMALEGKKVLVIHPFESTIIRQYQKRELLFANKNVLPSFDLRTIKAVQSIANNETAFTNWFDALDSMKDSISKSDFDIAIVGCGAYGLPLAAHIKRMGKKAIHIGGAVQCLFGIKGKRWEIPFYNYQEKFYNEHWVRPMESETPKDAIKAEGATYW